MNIHENNDTSPFDELRVSCKKWSPLTHALFNSNLDLVKHLISKSGGKLKKQIRVPGLFASEINQLFPFYVALTSNDQQMFVYFWDEIGD